MCMYAPSSVCVCKLIRCSFIRRVSWQTQCLIGTVTFQTCEARQERTREKRHWVRLNWSVKGKLSDPCSSSPLRREAITFEATISGCTYTQARAHTPHTRRSDSYSAFTQKVKSWIKEALISALIVAFWVTTFKCLCFTIHCDLTSGPTWGLCV